MFESELKVYKCGKIRYNYREILRLVESEEGNDGSEISFEGVGE